MTKRLSGYRARLSDARLRGCDWIPKRPRSRKGTQVVTYHKLGVYDHRYYLVVESGRVFRGPSYENSVAMDLDNGLWREMPKGY